MAGTELATAYVSIVPSAQGIKGNLERELNLDAAAKTAGESAGKSLSKSLITGATAAAAGVAIGSFFKAAFSEAQESQKVGAQTEAVLKSTGAAAHVSAGQVGELATALSKKAGIDDEVIQSGENVLLTFTKVRNEAGKGNDVFTRATKVALDMSVALGTDLKSANIQLGKALNDPIKGITALQRVGVSFTQQQKDQIATLVQSGDVLGAQKLILRELATEFGGSAAAQATAADKAGVAIKNLEESVGIALMPAFNAAADAVSFFTNILNDLPGPIRNIVVDIGLLGAGVLAAAVLATKFGGAFSLIASGATVAGEAIAGATSLLEGFTAAELAAAAAPAAALVAAFAVPAAALAGLGFAIDAVFGSDTTGGGSFGRMLTDLDKAKTLGKSWADTLIAGALQTAQPIAAVRQSIADLTKEGEKRLQQAQDQGKSDDELVVIAGRYKGAVDELKGKLVGLKQQEAEQAAATRETATGLEAYATALASGATQEAALAAAGDKGREAIQNLQNTLLAAAGGAVGYAQSQANLTKAQNDYTLAVFLFGATSAQAQAAQLSLNQAQLANVQAAQSADAAQQTLIDSLVSGSASYKDQIGLLLQQLQLHPENAAGIQLEVDKLDAAKTAADQIPGSKSIVLTAEDHVTEVLNRIMDNIRAVSPGFTIPFTGGPVKTSAGGNFLNQDEPSIVGEKGWELFWPKTAGTVIPHNESASMLQSAAMPLSSGGGGLFAGASVTIGDRNVIPDLDYFARTRRAGV